MIIVLSVADIDKDKYVADSRFYTGWKVGRNLSEKHLEVIWSFFQVLLHDPSEFPEVNKKGIFIGSGQEASIAIDAEVAICVLHLKFYNQYIPIMQWHENKLL